MAVGSDTRRMNSSPDGEHAFEKLILEHQQMIHSLCYRMTGSTADAEDLAQETFMRAYQGLATFRAEASVSSWLYRIAVNQCLNWKTRQKRQARLVQEWLQQVPSSANSDSNRARQIQESLMHLPAKQRAVIILTTYDGLTHAEAAKVIGCSETTVSWRLFAARRKLKQLLRGLQG